MMKPQVLRRLNSSRFSEVLPVWTGDTVVIIGGGASIVAEDVALVAAAHAKGEVRCVAVNDAYLLAPWADVHYAADAAWHQWHTEGIARPGLTAEEVKARWATFAGQKCSIEHSDGHVVAYEDVHMLRNANYPNHGWGLSTDPKALVTGRNSGFQALNLSTLAGVKRVLLLGFDGKKIGAASHWFGAHPKPTPQSAYGMYREAMSMAENDLKAAGVEVVNCSPGSAIDSFRKAKLGEVL